MAYGTFLHLEREIPYQPSTVDWLGPRVSFSTDFAPTSIGVKKEVSDDGPSACISGKHSPSEFDFSMSFQGQDRSFGSTMLSADELFYEGKLLPLYTPQQADLAALQTANSLDGVKPNGVTVRETEDSISKGPPFSVSQKIDSCPVSPKAPTCTSRWRELFGLKKTHVPDVKDAHGGKQQLKASQSKHTSVVDVFLAPARFSDAGKEPKATSRHSEAHSSTTGFLQDEGASSSYHFPFPLEPSPMSESGLNHFLNWQMDKAMSGSRSSKSSDDSDGLEKSSNMQKSEGTGAKQRSGSSQTKSSSKSADSGNVGTMSKKGSRGVSSGASSGGSRSIETSRSSTSARKAARSLDRTYSSSKGLRKKPEQVRSGRQSSGALERSTSYPASVRVSPVINVPYITPVLRKGSKNGIFGLSQFFSSKKDKSSKFNNRSTN